MQVHNIMCSLFITVRSAALLLQTAQVKLTLGNRESDGHYLKIKHNRTCTLNVQRLNGCLDSKTSACVHPHSRACLN